MSDSNNNNNNPQQIVSMGNGPSRCNEHDFETTDIEEWNRHCEETGHTESGATVCAGGCGKEIIYLEIPYQRVGVKGKGIELKCEDCIQKQDNLNRQILNANRQRQQQQNNNVGEGEGGNSLNNGDVAIGATRALGESQQQ